MALQHSLLLLLNDVKKQTNRRFTTGVNKAEHDGGGFVGNMQARTLLKGQPGWGLADSFRFSQMVNIFIQTACDGDASEI